PNLGRHRCHDARTKLPTWDLPEAGRARRLGALMCAKRRSTSSPSEEPQEPWFVRFRAKRTLQVSARQLTVILSMMSVVALPALGLWLGGKLAWNHDPLSSQRFRP